MKNLIQTKIPNVYSVKVPIDANDFRLYFEIGHTRLLYNKLSEDKFPITDYSFQNLVMNEEVNFKELGTITKSEISFDASELVEKSVLSDNLYKDYSDKWLNPLTAEQSFRSALPEEIYFDYNFLTPNKMKKTLPRLSEYNQKIFKWIKESGSDSVVQKIGLERIENVTNLVTQQLNISHFVPAVMKDGVWVVLDKPSKNMWDKFINYEMGSFDDSYNYCFEYQTALDNVVFKGFYTYQDVYEDLQGITNGDKRFVFDEDDNCFNSNDLDEQIKTIEDLIPYNLEITDKIAEKYGI